MESVYKNIPGCSKKVIMDNKKLISFEDETLDIAKSELFQRDMMSRIEVETRKLLFQKVPCKNRKKFFAQVLRNIAEQYEV
jgi:hypothetical protein